MVAKKPRRKVPIPTDKVTPGQYVAIAALLLGDPMDVVAAKAGCSVRTLWDWRHTNKAFVAEYQRRAASVADVVERKLRAAGVKAVQTLTDVMEATITDDQGVEVPRDPAPARVGAAREVLSRLQPERTAVEHSGRVGVNVEIESTERAAAAFRVALSLSDEDRARLRRSDTEAT